MRTRLLALLLALMAAVLLALGVPLAVSRAAGYQQDVVRDRVDDAAGFAAAYQTAIRDDESVTASAPAAGGDEEDGEKQQIRAQLEQYERVYGITAAILDRNGRPVVASDRAYTLPESGQAREAFLDARAGRRSDDPPQIWPWQHRRIVVAMPVVHRGDVVAVALTDSPTDKMRARGRDAWLFLAAGEAVALVVALLAAGRLTGTILRPVRVLDKATHEIATGKLGARVAAAQGPPELRRLAKAFNEMADNVETVVEQQRAFAADASHQLRNPLSALLLRIEELGLSLPPEHQDTLDGVRDEGRRLTHVLDELLALALAENAANTGPDLVTLDIAALVGERLDAWNPVALVRGQSFDRQGPRALTGHVDPIALGSALDAVIDNALKFSPDDAEITVAVATVGGRLEIRVADRGPGLEAGELRRVGDRFWRSSRHSNVDGSGLGLSIARTLLRATGGSIDFAARDGGGLVVTLTVDRAV
ncbi:HAMP domain-containing histidine kinase [Yinghuangia sp. ASG 101]|uniref:sensor histidine kinase n=1 Tax=Yinghuangia sp. ASG 101 TaxID=2896848 RepID=UPI001E448602|nr:HAMP domain-containing sensor histidine kinase [Yinghuangia sp. ASG 101]UGQ13919.1 HAMP domain-containing histidine kinase [Yinghuangia sp. ASG 101]